MLISEVQMDRYKALGPRQRIKTLEEALELIKSHWPGADFEGSTGFERSSAVRDDGIQWLVAHTWKIGRHTSELQSLMRISYAVFCLHKNNTCQRSQRPKV